MPGILKSSISFLLTVMIFFLLNTKHGDIPPPGKFLDPFAGFWNNAEKPGNKSEKLQLAGLSSKATVLFDDHRIPHVFADNEHDLYFIQGYLTARDRLWQMDFQTRFAAGRLSEVVGEKALELDKYQRRMGMSFGAENMVRALDTFPTAKKVAQAYADGVNAYIHSLKPRDYPLEFKILDYKPEDWKILNTGLLLKLMSATLTSSSDEFYMSNILHKYGPEVVKNLYPDQFFREDPIIPAGQQWTFTPVPIPLSPREHTEPETALAKLKLKERDEGLGSNNWALAGSHTASGYPILANDPHLDLTLPAIWYQMQLSAPGSNACGVSIPGAPGIISGFNENIAWGVTNVGADVLDWYRIKFKDANHREYWYNGKWRPTKLRIENIGVRGQHEVKDSVYYTHHGPVVYLSGKKPKLQRIDNVPEGAALKWIAHEPSVDIATFYLLNKAKNFSDYRKALSYFTAPAQNFVFASNQKDIAITVNGLFPLKWKDQGKFVLEGDEPENDWHGRIPYEQNPYVLNPTRGYVSSANQAPTDSTYPYYINWQFSGYERAHRINQQLAKMRKATPDSLRNLQNDTYSVLAEELLPTLLKAIDRKSLTKPEIRALQMLERWNLHYDANQAAPSLFEFWYEDLYKKIWEDDFSGLSTPMRFPSRDRTVHLITKEPGSRWFDDVRTPEKETRTDLINTSFKASVAGLTQRFGSLSSKWAWGSVKGSHIDHLANIPGLGVGTIFASGSRFTVNALDEKHGPSWRMIVALGKQPAALGIYPGGQSGNPGSFYYSDMLEKWRTGKLDKLLFLQSPNEKNSRIISKWLLSK